MAVDSRSFQPSRIGLGSMRGAPRPAGRISKSTWGASSASGETPIRPGGGAAGAAGARLGVGARRAAARRADLEEHVGRLLGLGRDTDPAEDGAGRNLRADLEVL